MSPGIDTPAQCYLTKGWGMSGLLKTTVRERTLSSKQAVALVPVNVVGRPARMGRIWTELQRSKSSHARAGAFLIDHTRQDLFMCARSVSFPPSTLADPSTACRVSFRCVLVHSNEPQRYQVAMKSRPDPLRVRTVPRRSFGVDEGSMTSAFKLDLRSVWSRCQAPRPPSG